MKSYIFGPVPSRRLGRSLGIDVVPHKTCTYDCVYCQLGRTTNKTIERKDWVSSDDVIADLEQRLSCEPDYITLSGSGEPTLLIRMGDLIERIRSLTQIPIAVLTNGSLLWQPDLRRELSGAHVVIPSLDAGNSSLFAAVNRPHPSISFEHMLDGLLTFREEFPGEFWLEIMLLAGHTGIDAEVLKLVECVNKIKPTRVQLNTVHRPPAEEYAAPVSPGRLKEFSELFEHKAEVVAEFRSVHNCGNCAADREDILRLLQRRPCTADDIAEGLSMHRNEVSKYLEELTARKQAKGSWVEGRYFYKI